MSSYYEHVPLPFPDSTRLIELHPGISSASLSCTILQRRLKDAPSYEAISYTWGAVDDQVPLECGLAGTSRDLMITRNCAQMLCRIRSATGQRRLWVDAICIDQENIDERNTQIAMMGSIYRGASRVVIDIGERSKDSDTALGALMHCSENRLYEMIPGLQIRDTVEDLYRRAWFGRVWVLQEVYWAQETVVMCGDRLVPWSIFRPFKIWVYSRAAWEFQEHWYIKLPDEEPQMLSIGNHYNRIYRAREDLLSLLCKGRTCNATDTRDKVFAMLPLLADAYPEGLRADYNKSTAQVFVETAMWLLSAVGLSFLPSAGGISKIAGVPSWVPDWSVQRLQRHTIGQAGLFQPLSAGLDTMPIAQVLSPGNVLKVRGVAVDKIRITTAPLKTNIRSDSSELDDFITGCRTYQTNDLRGPIRHPQVRRWEQKTTEERIHPPKWAAHVYGLPIENPGDISDNELANVLNYFCCGRELVQTERGSFGVAPMDTKPGDLVVCLLGSSVPYILRETRQDDSSGSSFRYRLIGESYLYGLMAGEGMKDIDLAEARLQDAMAPLADFHLE